MARKPTVERSIECRPVDGTAAAAWNAFVGDHPDGRLGHRFEWREVFEQAYRKRCIYLAAFRGDEWVGVLPLVRMRGPLSDRRLVSLPFLDDAGVLAVSDEVAGCLVAHAIDLSRKLGAAGLELREVVRDGVGGDARATMILTLPDSEEALWKTFKPKVRNQIRKAEKHGLRTVPGERRHRRDFYHVFCQNMRDLGSPVHGRSFVESVLEVFGADARLWVTLDETDRVVGGAIALRNGDTVTVPWASSLREVFTWCPNHSLYWSILTGSIAEGARRFDFGRSWLDSGTYRFKKQWGAEPHRLIWRAFDTRGRPEAGGGVRPDDHQRVVEVWKRLPLRLANLCGPILRRQLSN